MIYCDRLDVSEGIDVNKTSASKEYIICHYWYFLNKGFRFQTTICCKSSHYILLMSVDIKGYLHYKTIFCHKVALDV